MCLKKPHLLDVEPIDIEVTLSQPDEPTRGHFLKLRELREPNLAHEVLSKKYKKSNLKNAIKPEKT